MTTTKLHTLFTLSYGFTAQVSETDLADLIKETAGSLNQTRQIVDGMLNLHWSNRGR
ncbi:MAG: hypothetical protein NTV97_11375 [Alphaproteobacteria bacterium]|nr:hypothetical protein [Alphaproteobacteria bacterium]